MIDDNIIDSASIYGAEFDIEKNILKIKNNKTKMDMALSDYSDLIFRELNEVRNMINYNKSEIEKIQKKIGNMEDN